MGTVPDRQRAVKDREPAAEAFSALAVQVLSLAGALHAAGDVLTRPVGQSAARWRVLAAVEDRPDSVAGVARTLQLSRQSVQRVADLLVAEGLAHYRDNPDHARAKLLVLAPEGHAALQAIQTAQAAWAQRVAGGFDPDRLRAASEVLAEVINGVDRVP